MDEMWKTISKLGICPTYEEQFTGSPMSPNWSRMLRLWPNLRQGLLALAVGASASVNDANSPEGPQAAFGI